MTRLYPYPDDFEADVRILSDREGGRRTPACNGIRWDLRYWHQAEESVWMVWPEFVDHSGDSIPVDRPLSGLLKARFYIVNDDLREYHRGQARPGVGFFCVEGSRVSAAGIITRITGLFER